MGGITSLGYTPPTLSAGTTCISAATGGTGTLSSGILSGGYKIISNGIITFRMLLNGATAVPVSAQIFKNGVAAGTLRTVSSSIAQTFNEDIAVVVGDLITVSYGNPSLDTVFVNLTARASSIPNLVPVFSVQIP